MDSRLEIFSGTCSRKQARLHCLFALVSIWTTRRHLGPSLPVRSQPASHSKPPMARYRVAAFIIQRRNRAIWFDLPAKLSQNCLVPQIATMLLSVQMALKHSTQAFSGYCIRQACEERMSSRLRPNTTVYCDHCNSLPRPVALPGLRSLVMRQAGSNPLKSAMR